MNVKAIDKPIQWVEAYSSCGCSVNRGRPQDGNAGPVSLNRSAMWFLVLGKLPTSYCVGKFLLEHREDYEGVN